MVAAPIPSPWGQVTDLVDTATDIAAELPLPTSPDVTDAVAGRLADTTDRFVLASERCRTEVRLILQGLPEPQCGVPIRGASGKQYFADLLLDGLIIEVDGRLKYTDPQVLIDEKIREDDLRATGRSFHRVFVEDLYAGPAAEMQGLRDEQDRVHQSLRWAS